jgi:hypothetical protein
MQEISQEMGVKESDGSKHSEEVSKGFFSGRTATWLALAALAISVGHVVYAIWRDHINGGEGLLNFL